MLRQALILKVFQGASRSRRDCGNLEAAMGNSVVTPQRRRSRRDCGNLEAV